MKKSASRYFQQLAIVIGLGAFVGAMPGTASAAQPLGWYGGVSAGTSTISDFNDVCDDVRALLDPGAVCKTDDSDTGWKIYAGNRSSENLAVEFGYVNLGEASVNGSGTFFGTPAIVQGTWEATGIFGAVLGILPLSDSFSLFGKAGIAFTNVDLKGAGGSESASNVGLMVGLGLQIDFNKSVGIRIEWEDYLDVGDKDTTFQSDVQLASVGIIFRF